jgi:putative transcriptional regulator
MKSTFDQLMTGLDEVEAFLAGEQKGFKVHVPDQIDVKSIRNKLKMTQSRFSATFGFSLDAIKHWEGGRRRPEAPARTLLTVIEKNPAAVISALNPAVFSKVAANNGNRVHIRRKSGTFKFKKSIRLAARATRGQSTRSRSK